MPTHLQFLMEGLEDNGIIQRLETAFEEDKGLDLDREEVGELIDAIDVLTKFYEAHVALTESLKPYMANAIANIDNMEMIAVIE